MYNGGLKVSSSKEAQMSESKTDQGKSWVMEVFEQVREQYRETVPVAHIFSWRGGNTFEESQEELGFTGLLTYYLPFEVRQETHYITFTRQELTACSDPDNSEARFEIKKKILDEFTALESH
jgi:hypothetical protein